LKVGKWKVSEKVKTAPPKFSESAAKVAPRLASALLGRREWRRRNYTNAPVNSPWLSPGSAGHCRQPRRHGTNSTKWKKLKVGKWKVSEKVKTAPPKFSESSAKVAPRLASALLGRRKWRRRNYTNAPVNSPWLSLGSAGHCRQPRRHGTNSTKWKKL